MTAGSVDFSRAPIVVLGLGNLLLEDDAAGLRLLEALAVEDPRVDYVDGGTQGIALLGYLSERKAAVLLDAVQLGSPPGTIHLLRGEALQEFRARRAGTAHEGGAMGLLETARLLGDEPEMVVVLGIEPSSIRTGVGLSPLVEASIPDAASLAKDIIGELQQHVPCDSR